MQIGSSTSGAASVSLLRQALDQETQAAMTLINSIAQTPTAPVTPAANLPSHLGQNINTTA